MAGVIGRTYTWRSGACAEGVWRVICRWASPGSESTFIHPYTGKIEVSAAKGMVTYERHRPQPIRWLRIRGGPRNVLVESVETGERVVRPWYPAPRRVG